MKFKLLIFLITTVLFTGVSYSQPTVNRVKHQILGFSFIIPQGWICQQNQTGAIFGHNSIGGVVVLAAHYNSSLNAMKKEMLQGVSEQGLSLKPKGTFTANGAKYVSIQCEGFGQGSPVKGRSFGKLLNTSGGVFVTALATPAIYSQKLENAADAIVNSVKSPAGQGAGSSPVNLIQRFTGTWKTSSKYSQTSYRLYANGTFSSSAESSYGGNFSNQYANTGSWGTANENSGRGRWSVQGNETSGILTLQPAGEAPYQVRYHIHIEKGQRFNNEYLFDGKLYYVKR